MVGILTNTIECKRHQKYIKADMSLRKEMRFSSPGPLIDEHQKQLAKQLEELQLAHYPNKPAYLKHYEYDVLYPEVYYFDFELQIFKFIEFILIV